MKDGLGKAKEAKASQIFWQRDHRTRQRWSRAHWEHERQQALRGLWHHQGDVLGFE
jgi:hypothetical protein